MGKRERREHGQDMEYFSVLRASTAFSLTGKLSDNRISSCLGRADDIPVLSVPASQEGVSYPSQLAHPDSKI